MISSKMVESSQDYSLEIENFLKLPCNVYMKDIHGIYQKCNFARAESLGCADIADVIGKSDLQLHPVEEDCRLWALNDAEVLKNGTPKIFIEPVTFANRPTINMLSYKIPCYDKEEKIIGIFCISFPLDSAHQFSFAIPINKETLSGQSSIPIPHDFGNIKISKREKECLTCLVQGMTAKRIARLLNLSPRTIEFYIENMKKKLGCNNRIQLIAKAYDILK